MKSQKLSAMKNITHDRCLHTLMKKKKGQPQCGLTVTVTKQNWEVLMILDFLYLSEILFPLIKTNEIQSTLVFF